MAPYGCDTKLGSGELTSNEIAQISPAQSSPMQLAKVVFPHLRLTRAHHGEYGN